MKYDGYIGEEYDELKKEALAQNKPSDFGPSKDEMLDKFKKKYQKGRISKTTYDTIEKSLQNQKR